MKCNIYRIICSISAIFAGAAVGTAGTVYAQGSLGHAFAASTHASKAAAIGVRNAGRIALGVSAAPMIISGSALSAAGIGIAATGSASARAAGWLPGQALPVTDETITVMSPADALRPRTSGASQPGKESAQ